MFHGWRWLELHLLWCFGEDGFEALIPWIGKKELGIAYRGSISAMQ